MLTRVFIGLECYSFVGKLHQELLIYFFSDKMPDSSTEPRNNAEKVPKRNVPDKVAKNAPEKTTKTAQVQSLQPQSVAPSVAATSSKPARKNQETKVTKGGGPVWHGIWCKDGANNDDGIDIVVVPVKVMMLRRWWHWYEGADGVGVGDDHDHDHGGGSDHGDDGDGDMMMVVVAMMI